MELTRRHTILEVNPDPDLELVSFEFPILTIYTETFLLQRKLKKKYLGAYSCGGISDLVLPPNSEWGYINGEVKTVMHANFHLHSPDASERRSFSL